MSRSISIILCWLSFIVWENNKGKLSFDFSFDFFNWFYVYVTFYLYAFPLFILDVVIFSQLVKVT